MKKRNTGLLASLIIIVALGSFALHAVPRWQALRDILADPERVSLLEVIPESRIEITPPKHLRSAQANLGYAEFSLPPDITVNAIFRSPSDLVLLESDRLSLGFRPPDDRDTSELFRSLKRLASQSSEGGMWGSLLDGESATPARANIVDLHMLAAVTRPVPFIEALKMSNGEFKAYLALLTLKSMICPPSKRIVPYEATNSIGLIYFIGRNHGHIEMTSHDREIQQTIRFNANADPPDSFLLSFLASYRFTLDSSPSQERISELIASTGIPLRHLEEDLADNE